MKQYGVAAGASDLAVILGAEMDPLTVDPENNEATTWWSALFNDIIKTVLCVEDEVEEYHCPHWRSMAVRPALPPHTTSQIPKNQVRFTRKINGAQIVEYGEYPQSALAPQDALKIEHMRIDGKLRTTGKKYTFDTIDLGEYFAASNFVHYDEYMDGNARYVRVLGRRCDGNSRTRNGISVKSGGKYWLRVEPIEWLADPSGWWVAKDCLFAGIRFNSSIDYDGSFAQTDMNAYLRLYFAKQILVPEQKIVAAAKAPAAKPVVANGEPTVESVREFIKKECGAGFVKDFDKR